MGFGAPGFDGLDGDVSTGGSSDGSGVFQVVVYGGLRWFNGWFMVGLWWFNGQFMVMVELGGPWFMVVNHG